MRCAPVLLVMLCTQGAGYRPPAGVQELEATLGGQVTVISGSSPLWNKEHISSWCRQATREICDDLVDSNGATSRGYKGRAALVSHPKKGPPRVTISGLRDWDTGLYCWRTWNGTSYTLVKRLLLQVLHGFHPESHPRVLRLAEGGPATLECLYAQAKRWSKVWCKQTDEDTCDWIGHSDGVTNLEYVSRALVTNDPQAGRMALVLKELQIWDTGAYRCMESGGSVVLCTVVLVVSPAGSSVEDVSRVHKTPRRESPTPPSRPAPGPTPPGAERGAHSRPWPS
ncbi:polymeric immunoglobulin receptor-like [Ambystoma mexicanum]|uniref:polymeric immunoglobulin receptor-like n=1 Tax=Ambystoma mexicanum TaxID=8296 RepID=UPI0037E96032